MTCWFTCTHSVDLLIQCLSFVDLSCAVGLNRNLKTDLNLVEFIVVMVVHTRQFLQLVNVDFYHLPVSLGLM